MRSDDRLQMNSGCDGEHTRERKLLTVLIQTLLLMVPRIRPVRAWLSKHCRARRPSPSMRSTCAYSV
ncbi:hypothetical protein EON65_13945 [archaeon]|nr:MAG: hypothetical protein EON65_13945 [archaeon]